MARRDTGTWNPDDAVAEAVRLRDETLGLARTSPLMAELAATQMRATERDAQIDGAKRSEARRDIFACYGQRPSAAAPDPDFALLARLATRQESRRLRDAPLYVVDPAALEELEAAIAEGIAPDAEPIAMKLPTPSGFLLLPQPIFTRAANSAITAIRAAVWGSQAAAISPDGRDDDLGAGFRLSIYHDPTAAPTTYGLQALSKRAQGMGTSVPPLLYQRADLYFAHTWDELIKTEQRNVRIPGNLSRSKTIDSVPEGRRIFDDPRQALHLSLMRAFTQYASQELNIGGAEKPPRQPRSGPLSSRPDLKLIYVPGPRIPRDRTDAKPGGRFTPQGEHRRKNYHVPNWPVSAVIDDGGQVIRRATVAYPSSVAKEDRTLTYQEALQQKHDREARVVGRSVRRRSTPKQ